MFQVLPVLVKIIIITKHIELEIKIFHVFLLDFN